MTLDPTFARHVQDAVECFQQASTPQDLLGRLGQHLAPFAISGRLYGSLALRPDAPEVLVLLDSFPQGHTQAKMDEGVFYDDSYLEDALVQPQHQPQPIVWNDSSRLPNLAPAALRSLTIDADFGVITGVTIPMRFAGGWGESSIGCHAAGLSHAEFGRLWAEHGATMVAIVNAFGTAVRRDHGPQLVALTDTERECLLWLAAGLQRKQIADRLNLTDKQVEKRLAQARHKLKATTTAQALVTALIHQMIAP